MHRLRKIPSLYWQVGPVIPDTIHHDILSDREYDFFSSYSEIVGDYCREIDLDLTMDLEVIKFITTYYTSIKLFLIYL
jgi:hypothetical protein